MKIIIISSSKGEQELEYEDKEGYQELLTKIKLAVFENTDIKIHALYHGLEKYEPHQIQEQLENKNLTDLAHTARNLYPIIF
mmetsp:Transcript_41078/g.36417  ORF Transcript_41078/g.36417 Transcript_41078/m.36417 type:complete len:82 (-) Transcript_41078:354-599(-)